MPLHTVFLLTYILKDHVYDGNMVRRSVIRKNDVRVTVHDRATSPLIEDNGHMVEPNTATDIAIERVSMFLQLLN